MPKRKSAAASSEEDEDYNEQERGSGSETPERPIQSARRSGKKAKKQASSEEESSEEEQLKTAKKSKATKPAVRSVKKPKYGSPSKSAKDSRDAPVGVNEAGEKYLDLGKKRRATVRQFKGATFLDIREFYGDDNDLKPGKKGISLAKEQWETLKNNSDIIDSFFAKLGK
ncbi:PC4-domain-containing protein [Trametes cingulata]|nr:PC4-domain-containing protein [Trametes cingulata]